MAIADTGQPPGIIGILQLIGGLVIVVGFIGAAVLWNSAESGLDIGLALGVALSLSITGLVLIALAAVINELRMIRAALQASQGGQARAV